MLKYNTRGSGKCMYFLSPIRLREIPTSYPHQTPNYSCHTQEGLQPGLTYTGQFLRNCSAWQMSGRQSASSATATSSVIFGDSSRISGGSTNPKVFSMYNGRGRSSYAPDFSKRYKNNIARSRQGGSVQRFLLRWLRRPSTFLLTGFCLLVIPPLWFVSRHAEPTPDFIPELDGGGKNNLRAPATRETRRTEESPPAETVRLPAAPPEPERVKVPNVAARATAAPPPPPPPPTAPPSQDLRKENERIKRKHSEWHRKATMSPWRPPVLPVEMFRDVPPEECLRSPLTEKRVNPSDYEFGCEEIYVSKAFF